MNTGHVISGTGHLTLIGWMLLGGIFTSEPPPFEATQVSVISGADFEALMAAQQAPDQTTDVAQPAPPEVTPDTPEVTPTPDLPPQQPAPEQTPAPPEETPPDAPEQTPPAQADVADTPPDQPIGDVAVQVPDVAPQAVPRPVERVAPQPVAQPDPDATPDDTAQEAVTEADSAQTPQETQEATAPEEATTEIVTEATAAPKASSRPPGRRPAAPAPAQTAQNDRPAPAQENSSTDTASINDALTEALGNPAPSGPPLSAGEKESLRVAVSNCWNVDVGGRSANTVVTVAVALDRAGKVVGDVRLIASDGGDDAAVRTAFGAARRAILRCQKGGFPLPAEKYDHWKEVEMTFNPERMRVK